ncbi:hypothetical protein EDB80DRAFT_674722 [Ilyonectria destructans]|nr:hypothetical protein EDB80DRAFT_674722 [Ilyonectria destructans]
MGANRRPRRACPWWPTAVGQNGAGFPASFEWTVRAEPSAWRWINRPVGGLLGRLQLLFPRLGGFALAAAVGKLHKFTSPLKLRDILDASRHRDVEGSFSQWEDLRKYNSQSSVTEIGGIFHGARSSRPSPASGEYMTC